MRSYNKSMIKNDGSAYCWYSNKFLVDSEGNYDIEAAIESRYESSLEALMRKSIIIVFFRN